MTWIPSNDVKRLADIFRALDNARASYAKRCRVPFSRTEHKDAAELLFLMMKGTERSMLVVLEELEENIQRSRLALERLIEKNEDR